MLFLRLGPQYMLLRTTNSSRVEATLVELSAVRGHDLPTTLGNAGENDSVVLLAPPSTVESSNPNRTIFMIPHPTAKVLVHLITSNNAATLSSVELGPGFLLMRIPACGSALIDRLAEEYNGRRVDLQSGIDSGDSGDTLLSFTVHPISTTVAASELEPDLLLIHRPANSLFQDLRQGAVRYFTEALQEDESEWYELRINIYDAYGNYKLHLDRLILTLEDREAGLILGERWTRDHGFALLSVTAYQVRLFTHWHPLAIKELLLGLEYNADGRRIVDLDLYYKNQKLNWVQTIKGKRRQSRAAVGIAARDKLLAELSPLVQRHLAVQEQAAPS